MEGEWDVDNEAGLSVAAVHVLSNFVTVLNKNRKVHPSLVAHPCHPSPQVEAGESGVQGHLQLHRI